MKRAAPLLLLFLIATAFSESKVNKCIVRLKDGDWEKVADARNDLMDYADKALDALVQLTTDTSIQPLTNAATIIYPGTTQYTGKGTVIDFDLDRPAVRAGWIIEELSFNDFGYRANTVSDDRMLDIRKQHPEEIRKNQPIAVSLGEKGSLADRNARYAACAVKVQDWWNANKTGWSRYAALKDALKSDLRNRQLLALKYLRTGTTKMDKLNKTSWENELKTLVLNISKNGKPGPNEEAKLLLNDTELFWLQSKK